MKRLWPLAGIIIGVAAVGGLLWLAFAPVTPTAGQGSRIAKAPEKKASKPTAAKPKPAKPSASRPAASKPGGSAEERDEWVESREPKYRKLAADIVAAIDANDLDKTLALAAEAQSCPDAEIRQRMVESLSWFGQDAVSELTGFLVDRDPEVAKNAFNAWDQAVEEMDDGPLRNRTVGAAMKVLDNRESLQVAAAKLEASEDRKSSLMTIAELSEGKNEIAAQCAKEAYEFITGEEWRGPAIAKLKAITNISKE